MNVFHHSETNQNPEYDKERDVREIYDIRFRDGGALYAADMQTAQELH